MIEKISKIMLLVVVLQACVLLGLKLHITYVEHQILNGLSEALSSPETIERAIKKNCDQFQDEV